MPLKKLTVKSFLNTGARLHPYWSAAQEAYESHWLGADSPFRGEGEIFMYADDTETIRICLLKKNGESQSKFRHLFCFYARGKDTSPEERTAFFRDLRRECKVLNIPSLLGPLPFSTWHPYRFVVSGNGAAFFPGEEPLPAEWYRDFMENGFQKAAGYESILVTDLPASIELGLKMNVEKSLPMLNIREYEGKAFVKIARNLFGLSESVFKDNYGYSPIAYEDFCNVLVEKAPDHTYLVTAEVQGRLMGFAYSYSIGHWNGLTRPTSVLKTLGVHPDFRNQKVGYGLSYLTHKYWVKNEHHQIIHAYMRSTNASKSMSQHFGETMRDYALVEANLNSREK